MRLLTASLLVSVALATSDAVAVPHAGAPRPLTKRQHLGYSNDQIFNTTRINFCSDVHQIIVRATGEPPSMGVIGTLATLINSRLPGSTLEWIDYPAVLMPYDQSTAEGNKNLQNVVRGWADKCEGKIVLLGYSQGAQIVGDVMCGAGGGLGLGPHIDPLEQKYQDRIAAIVQMGDPRRTIDMPWNEGTATRTGGLFPRIFPDTVCSDTAGAKMRSYCDDFDPFCATNGVDMHVHESYTTRYNEDAAEFVLQKLDECKSCGTSSGKPSDSIRRTATSSAPLALLMLMLLAVVF